jgi:hypothetical protein
LRRAFWMTGYIRRTTPRAGDLFICWLGESTPRIWCINRGPTLHRATWAMSTILLPIAASSGDASFAIAIVISIVPCAISASVPAELVQHIANRSAGDLDKPAIRLIHFNDQVDRTGHRQRTGEERGDHASVRGSEETEAGQDHGKPEHQNSRERPLNSAPSLLHNEPTRLHNIDGQLQRRRFEPTLGVVPRGKIQELG